MTGTNKHGLTVFIIVILLAALLSVIDFFSPVLAQKLNIQQPVTAEFDSANKIILPVTPYAAQINISGTIQKENNTYNQKWLLSLIKLLKNDPNNAGIILFIDSPGGTVYESDEAYLALMDYKTTGRPVYAYLGSVAASGAYYIACAADKIYANRNTITGSIGIVYGTYYDLTGLRKNLGISSTTIHSGNNKTIGSFGDSLSEEHKKILQSVADEAYEQFAGIVAESRNFTQTQIAQIADGRIYTAQQASRNGLIDNICSYDECVSLMMNNALRRQIQLVTYKYTKERKFSDLLTMKASIKTENASLKELHEEISFDSPAFYYSGF